MHIIALPALADNYIWLMHDDDGNAAVVDPGDSRVVEDALAARGLRLRGVLLTHHHPDHVGGAQALRNQHACPVYAPVDDRIGATTDPVREGCDVVLSEPPLRFKVMEVPGHTLSHIAFVGEGLVFCGDTLFSMGCGRLFEGTPEQMLASLDRLAALPGETLVCAGHEYTAANGRFAHTVSPHNRALEARVHDVAELRRLGRPTLPVRMSVEMATNPFLRVDDESVVHWCREHATNADDRVSRFAALRRAKDAFVS